MMIKRKVDKFWFPWWPDKWIFGSVRIEFTVAERGIWVDLLSLASKDNGHIRANEETPYPITQLAGMLIIPEDELESAINKFIEKTKLTKMKDGTLYVTKWDKYQFSRTARFYAEKGRSEQNGSHSEQKGNEYIKLNNNIVNYNIINNDFSLFWEYYNNKVAKKDALKAYTALRRKKVTHEEIMEAAKGYFNHLRNEEIHSNFKKAMMYPATFLRNDKWKDFIGVTYKPPM